MNQNSNRVAIVTGAAKNIGRATCESLSKLGFNILVHANTDKDGANETVDLIKKKRVTSSSYYWRFNQTRYISRTSF